MGSIVEHGNRTTPNGDSSTINPSSPVLPDRSLCRSPPLSNLPENDSHFPPSRQTNVTDFAQTHRQFTDSSTTTSENIGTTSRSSTNPLSYQTIQSPSNSENQLQAARQVMESHRNQFESLRETLKTIPSPNSREHPRLPMDEDFKAIRELRKGLVTWKVKVYPEEKTEPIITKIILVLHDQGGEELSLKPFIKQQLPQQDAAFVFLGGRKRMSKELGGGLWWADDHLDGLSFHESTRLILDCVTNKVLISRCNFAPSNIALLGHGQGGSVALSIAAICGSIRLGGVITVDGPAPDYIRPQIAGNPTPVLVLGGKLGVITPQAEKNVRDLFQFVDLYLRPGAEKVLLDSDNGREEGVAMRGFLAHSLGREEWETQAVLALDGGGIRGYGSLLVLKELMRRIGQEENRLDANVESSFHPEVFKPTVKENERPRTAGSQQSPVIGTPTANLQEADLFLPCHYFTYIGGTSTGGLISIMLSRFRMTVNDCITEYKKLGGKVFAHPRPLAKGGVLWHKFSAANLHNAIQEVTNRHCFHEKGFGAKFPSDPDFCRTVVLAYSEEGTTDAPYLFRTYQTFPRHHNKNVSQPGPGIIRRPTTLALKNTPIHNPGRPSDVAIPQVGRATSAAPSYFPPVRIPITDSDGVREVRFKDGGFGSNNPSLEIYHDVLHKHGGFSKNVSVFVSVGTGNSKLKMFDDREGWTRAGTRVREALANLRAATQLPARTTGAHNSMLGNATRDNKTVFSYSRFDGGPRLGKVKMDEWKSNTITNIMTGKKTFSGSKTLREIEDSVAVYLADPKIQTELDETARILVHRRRLRTRDKSHWDRYASASWYECPFTGCKDSIEYKTYTLFEEHVRKEHYQDYISEPIEQTAHNYRKCWLYRGG